MAFKLNTAEGATQGVSPTTASVPASGNALFAVTQTNGTIFGDSDAAVHGTMGYTCTRTASGSTGAYITMQAAASSPTTGVMVYYKNGVPRPTNTTSILAVRNSGSGSMGTLQVTSAGKFVLLGGSNSAVAGVSTTYVVPQPGDGNNVRIWLYAVPGTTTTDGTLGFDVFLDESSTPAYSYLSNTVNAGTLPGQYGRYGIIGDAGGAYAIKIDDIYIGDEGDPGPFATSPGVTLTTYETNHVVRMVSTNGSNPVTSTTVSPTTDVLSYGTTLDKTFILPHVDLGDDGVEYTFTATDGTFSTSDTVTVEPDVAAAVVNIAAPKVHPAGLPLSGNEDVWE